MTEPNAIPIIVRTYTSSIAISYVVVRVINGVECVINTDIKPLTRQQRSLSRHRLEIAALKFALDANTSLLSQNDYVVEADYRPLMSLRSHIQ